MSQSVRFRPVDKNELMQWINNYCKGTLTIHFFFEYFLL
jgi:hypothetical protein